VRISADHDLTGFHQSGARQEKDYKALCEAIDRLAGIRASRRTSARVERGANRQFRGLNRCRRSIRRKHGLDGRLLLGRKSSYLICGFFNAIRGQGIVLTTSIPITSAWAKPLERRIYELARQTLRPAGTLVDLPRLPCSRNPARKAQSSDFRQHVIAYRGTQPSPRLPARFRPKSAIWCCSHNRDGKWVERPPALRRRNPAASARRGLRYEGRAAAPGYDIHGLESEWREWWVKFRHKPRLRQTPPGPLLVSAGARHKRRRPIQREVDSDWSVDPCPVTKSRITLNARRDALWNFRWSPGYQRRRLTGCEILGAASVDS